MSSTTASLHLYPVRDEARGLDLFADGQWLYTVRTAPAGWPDQAEGVEGVPSPNRRGPAEGGRPDRPAGAGVAYETRRRGQTIYLPGNSTVGLRRRFLGRIGREGRRSRRRRLAAEARRGHDRPGPRPVADGGRKQPYRPRVPRCRAGGRVDGRGGGRRRVRVRYARRHRSPGTSGSRRPASEWSPRPDSPKASPCTR